MKHSIKSLVIICFLTFFSVRGVSQDYDINASLTILDHAIDNVKDFQNKKQKEIDNKKELLKDAKFDSDCYVLYKQLHLLYKKYDGDSAMTYADKCLQLAERNQRKDWEKEALLMKARIHTIRGEMMLARKQFIDLGHIDSLPDAMRSDYAKAALNYRRIFNRTYHNSKFHQEQLQGMDIDWERLPSYFVKGTEDYYFVKCLIEDFDAKDIPAIQRIVEKQDKHSNGRMHYTLARYLQSVGDSVGYRYYLIQSAIINVENAFKCSDSMFDIISSEWLQENPERAFRYALLLTDEIHSFRNLNRSLAVINLQNKIVRKFIEEKEESHQVLMIVLIVIAVLCIAIAVQTRRLHLRSRKMDKMNKQLDEQNKLLAANMQETQKISAQIKASNNKLMQEIKMRDQNFINTYLMCSEYIKIHINFKKTMVNLLKTNSIKSAIKLASANDINELERKDFYRKFDLAFLSTHPDFIERFNRLLQKEYHYVLNEDQELTPELRIYALISLGINNSINIAEFLHYSAQTIYNYRLRMRHQACISEKDFAEAVGCLYDDEELEKYLYKDD